MLIDARVVRGQAPSAGPLPQPLDRLARGRRDRHDVLRGLRERHIQKRRETATRANLSTRPAGIARLSLFGVQAKATAIANATMLELFLWIMNSQPYIPRSRKNPYFSK